MCLCIEFGICIAVLPNIFFHKLNHLLTKRLSTIRLQYTDSFQLSVYIYKTETAGCDGLFIYHAQEMDGFFVIFIHFFFRWDVLFQYKNCLPDLKGLFFFRRSLSNTYFHSVSFPNTKDSYTVHMPLSSWYNS